MIAQVSPVLLDLGRRAQLRGVCLQELCALSITRIQASNTRLTVALTAPAQHEPFARLRAVLSSYLLIDG